MNPRVRRAARPDEAPEVTHMELFFDLVFVFAFIQVSHLLLHHLTWPGVLETVVVFLAVWWAWNYTAWATNWVDPNEPRVRGLMVVLMLLSLVMAVAIPDAFGSGALVFAVSYTLLQIVRSAFMVAALAPGEMSRNYVQLLTWSAIAGIAWIAGALVDPELRLFIWSGAVVLDYAAPMHGFALPGMGSTPMSSWTLKGAHLAERGQLVVLIAIGESILEIGLTSSDVPWSPWVMLGFLAGFVLTVSLWWMYFIRDAGQDEPTIATSEDPAWVGRSGYAYGHAVMVAGVIVIAVANALVIGDPTAPMSLVTGAVILGGPGLYLAGNALFNHAAHRRSSAWRMVSVASILPLALVAPWLSPVVLLTLVACGMLLLAVATGTPHRGSS